MTTTSATRAELERRLIEELGDAELAAVAARRPDDELIDQLRARVGDAIGSTPVLSYHPPTVADDDVDTLWVLAFGYRLSPTAATHGPGEIPPMSDLVPGPINEALAREAADFVAHTPVPIVAQWEVAEVLDSMGVTNVISVEPDVAADGTVVYLSTADVLRKGLALAAAQGIDAGQAGVLGHRDHVSRCLLTAADVGMTGAVPASVRLPKVYDAESGQPWTRSRADFVPLDVFARMFLDPTG